MGLLEKMHRPITDESLTSMLCCAGITEGVDGLSLAVACCISCHAAPLSNILYS